jgi:hypothetical protein
VQHRDCRAVCDASGAARVNSSNNGECSNRTYRGSSEFHPLHGSHPCAACHHTALSTWRVQCRHAARVQVCTTGWAAIRLVQACNTCLQEGWVDVRVVGGAPECLCSCGVAAATLGGVPPRASGGARALGSLRACCCRVVGTRQAVGGAWRAALHALAATLRCSRAEETVGARCMRESASCYAVDGTANQVAGSTSP